MVAPPTSNSANRAAKQLQFSMKKEECKLPQ